MTLELRGPVWLQKISRGRLGQRIVCVGLDLSQATDKELELLRDLRDLTKVEIRVGSGKITDAGLKHLVEIKNLSDLMIDGASDRTLRQVSQLKQLEHLALRGQFTDDGMKHLGVLHQLETLRLMSPRMTDDGLVSLHTINRLRELSLTGTITDAGMRHLKALKNLESLDCEGHPATAEIFRQLDQVANLEFVETPLVDVADYLSDLHGIVVRLDPQALEEVGLGPTTAIDASISGVSLRKGLREILGPLNLDWTPDSTGLTITAKQVAEETRRGIIELQRSLPHLKEVDVDW